MTRAHPFLMPRWLGLCLALSLSTAWMPAAARSDSGGGIWRCGPDGRSFSDRPCADGSRLDVRAPPPMGDPAEARQQAQRVQVWAERLSEERRQREFKAAGAGLAGIQSLPRPLPPAQPAAETPAEAKPPWKRPKPPRTRQPARPGADHTRPTRTAVADADAATPGRRPPSAALARPPAGGRTSP